MPQFRQAQTLSITSGSEVTQAIIQTSDSPTLSKPDPCTKKNLKALLLKWQQKLRLEDWKIDISVSKDLEDDLGQVIRHSEVRVAIIEISPFERFKDAYDPYLSVEVTVVHELLHVLLAPVFPNDENQIENNYEEQIIDTLARALVGYPIASRKFYQ